MPITISESGASPGVASDGFAFLVAWRRNVPNIVWPLVDIVDAIVANDGVTGTEFLLTEETTNDEYGPKVAWSVGRYLVAWLTSGPYHGWNNSVRFVGPNGVPLNRGALPTISLVVGAVADVACSGAECVVLTAGNNIYQEYDALGLNRYVVESDGTVTPGAPLPHPFWYIAYDGHEYAIAPAPVAALEWPFVAIADHGAVHIVSVLRRHTAAH